MEQLDPVGLARLIAGENEYAVTAAVAASEALARAMRAVADAFLGGARTIYVGAGTSARIAAADAAEMPPTFGVEPDRFVALVAGAAVARAKEGAEDDRLAAREDLDALSPAPPDIVLGISASGTTPYVLAAIARAAELGIRTVGIANNAETPLLEAADIPVLLDTGPEVLAGSTRLKAGTAQKVALNTISTGAMVLAGRVRGNQMSHMTPNNEKLRARAARIVAAAKGIAEHEAAELLAELAWDIEAAIEA